jgi:HK97 gp10 family phage protein
VDDTRFEITSSFDDRKYPEKWEKAMDRALPTIGLFVQGEAMLRAPVGKYPKGSGRVGGRLRGSLTYATTRGQSNTRTPATPTDSVKRPYDRETVHIGTNVEYAPYVEYGTRRMKAQPYLRPAMDDNRDRILELYQREVHREMG